ncbi:hypothetical protein [Virgibacillus siamensis]|uniref:hypothetical protein n=1 Tax=Virgibacillus siamensis TaxID=480071 RepID=UPI0009852632|nr:hypothetical protein [Virgibacillus siamensis]
MSVTKRKKEKAYNEISEELRFAILVDYEQGTKWRDIAEFHEVDYRIVESVCRKRQFEEREAQERKEGERGTKTIRYFKGERLSDGKPSPIKKYNLKDLTEAEKKELGFLN